MTNVNTIAATTPDGQLQLARDFVAECRRDGLEIDGGVATILDYLAIMGVRFAPLQPDDYDEDGVSIVAHAYFRSLR